MERDHHKSRKGCYQVAQVKPIVKTSGVNLVKKQRCSLLEET